MKMHNTSLRNGTENKAFIKCERDVQYIQVKQCAVQVKLSALKSVIMHL
jgi:hypothetical protein